MRHLPLLAAVLAAVAVPRAARSQDDCQKKAAAIEAADGARQVAQDELTHALDELNLAVERVRAAERAFDEARRKTAVDQRAWQAAALRAHACMAQHRRDWHTACASALQATRDTFAKLEADREQMDRFGLEIGGSEMDADAARKAFWKKVEAVEKAITDAENARKAAQDCEPSPPPSGKRAR